MFHAQWNILLSDDELAKAMEHGMVILCNDGTERRFFPRIFTYTADYPEK
jgi:Plavaka transposase